MSRTSFGVIAALATLLVQACSSNGSGDGAGSHDCGQVCERLVSLCPSEYTTQADRDECTGACSGASANQRTCIANAPSCDAAEDCFDDGSGGSGGGGGSGGSGGGGGSGADCSVGSCHSLSDGAKACLVNGELPSGSEYCSYSNPCPSGKYCIFNSSESGCVSPCGGYQPPGGCPSQCKPYGSSVCCGGALCSGDCIGNPCCS